MNLTQWKNSGDLYLPKQIQTILNIYLVGDDSTVIYVNIWSIVHFCSGVLIALLYRHYTTLSVTQIFNHMFIIHLCWEGWQILIGNTPNTIRGTIDVIMDTLFFSLGYAWIFFG